MEWVAYSFSKGSSRRRNRTLGLLHCRRILYQLSYHGSPVGQKRPLLGQPPNRNYNSQRPLRWRAVATMRLRSGAGSSCVVPANSCGSPSRLGFCVPWRRLTLPSCPSCLSFITEGSFPTASTIAGSTMAEVTEAGRGWWGVCRGVCGGLGRAPRNDQMKGLLCAGRCRA